MARKVADSVLDAALGKIATATSMIALDGEPADRAAALSGALATAALTSEDFTVTNGDVSGRKVTIGAQNGIEVDVSGDANHIALIDDSELLYVTVCSEQPLTEGNTVDFGAWKVEIADPTAPA